MIQLALVKIIFVSLPDIIAYAIKCRKTET